MNERYTGLIVAPTLARKARQARTSELARGPSLAASFAGQFLLSFALLPNLNYAPR